jgi:tetratricopeptide (TPR) repeat protein
MKQEKEPARSLLITTIIIVQLFFCLPLSTSAQDRELDSLKHLNASLKNDTNKCRVLNKLAWTTFLRDDYPGSMEYSTQSGVLSKALSYEPGMAESFNIQGVVYCSVGDYPKALDFFLNSLRLNEKLNNKRNISRNLMNIGIVNMYLTDFEKALETLERSLQINQQRNDSAGIASSLTNLALVYHKMKNYPLSLDVYDQALTIQRAMDNEPAIANTLMNIGFVYKEEGDVARTANDDAESRRKYKIAEEYYSRSLEMQEKLGDRSGIAYNLGNIGSMLLNMNRLNEAEKVLTRALELSEELDLREQQGFHHQTLVELYKARGDYRNALEHQQKKEALNDSLYSENKQRELVKKQMQYDFEKKEATMHAIAQAEKEKIRAVAAAENKKQLMVIVATAILLLLVAIFSVFMFNRYRVTQRQKKIIEKQKLLVDEKNKEIQDSISYARRIQRAIMPPGEYLSRFLPQHFVFYQPKDIVAGDFYWMQPLWKDNNGNKYNSNSQERQPDCILVAVADSTGHGVPGAMVSVVCDNALNRAVLEFGLTEPGKILDKTTEIVLETFMKSGEIISDGMDISILCIQPADKKVLWSGANNNLLYTDPSQPGMLKELVANKQPVGRSHNHASFTTHILPYQKGMMFYLFTDGFIDQFGGPKGKKFRYKHLQEFLGQIMHLTAGEQHKLFASTFIEWKGNLEQVDDVCIMGIRI